MVTIALAQHMFLASLGSLIIHFSSSGTSLRLGDRAYSVYHFPHPVDWRAREQILIEGIV